MLLVVWNKKFYYLISTETRNNIPPYSTRSFINSIKVFETNNNLHGFLIAKSHFLERLNECGITVFSHIKIPLETNNYKEQICEELCPDWDSKRNIINNYVPDDVVDMMFNYIS